MPFAQTDKGREQQRESNKRYYEKNRQMYINRNKAHKKQNAEWFEKYKATLKCEVCGENHPACLDFHHIDPTQKVITVSQAIFRWWKLEDIQAEIAKCRVLCANCHRKIHYEEKYAGLG